LPDLFTLLKDNNGIASANNGFGMPKGKMENCHAATNYF
jgi:hypothetical protein